MLIDAASEPAQAEYRGEFMADNDNPRHPAQLSLGGIVANLPAVRAARKANTMSRVHRRLIEPIETEQDNEARLSFQHTVFCQTGLPYRNPGDDVGQKPSSPAKRAAPRCSMSRVTSA